MKQKHGRHKIVLGMVVLLIVAVASTAGYFWMELQKPSLEKLAKMVPEDASLMLVLRGGPKLALDFDLMTLSKELEARQDPGMLEAVKKLKEILGFDPSNRAELLNSGINLLAPMGASIHVMGENEFLGAIYIPVTDKDKMAALLSRIAAHKGTEIEMTTSGNTDVYSAQEGKLQYTFHNNYLVGAGSDDSARNAAFLGKIADGSFTSASDSKWFASMNELVNKPWEVLALVNPKIPAGLEAYMEMPEMQEALATSSIKPEDMAGFGFAIDVEPTSIKMLSQLRLTDDSTAILTDQLGNPKDTLASMIPGKAVGSMRVAIDFNAMLANFKKSKEFEMNMAKAFDSINVALGVDVEKDIVAYLGSPYSLTIMSEQSQASMGYGGALWLPLKAGHDIDGFLAKLADKAQAEGAPVENFVEGDNTWYSMEKDGLIMSWGVARDHFVLAMGEPFANDLGAALNSPKGSFLEGIDGTDTRNIIESEGAVGLYIDVAALVAKHSEQLADAPPKVHSLVNSIKSITASSINESRMACGDLTISAKADANFAAMLHELAKNAD